MKPKYIAKFKDELQNRMKNIHKYGSVEEIWKLFKHSIETASTTLPKKKQIFEKKWVNDEVKKLKKLKAEYHLKIHTLKHNGKVISQHLKKVMKN